jgi:hypothetical protein
MSKEMCTHYGKKSEHFRSGLVLPQTSFVTLSKALLSVKEGMEVNL